MAGSELLHGFIASLSVNIFSELGDRTFFIAAILAMRHSRLAVATGVLASQSAMTVLSAMLGYGATVIPQQVTYYATSLLFFAFGMKTIHEGWNMDPDEAQEEYEEAEEEISRKAAKPATVQSSPVKHALMEIFHPALTEAFVLTFFAEWGDKSQIATVVLSAREGMLGVILGGCLGQALCTILAVSAGRIVAQKISAKTVTLAGGLVFILFAVTSLMYDPD